jgi:Ca2+-binding EF-hand superfamily protein
MGGETASKKSRKDKKPFGLFRRKPKDVTPITTAVPPSVVNVNSPGNVSQMTVKTRTASPSAPTNLLPGFEDHSGTIIFEDDATKATGVSYKPPITKKAGWLARSKRFKELSNWAFDAIDTDGSGCVDEKELYSGLLLIHLKLGCYAGPAACRPVDRQRVHDVFLKMDVDQSGSLDREEFLHVMMILCSNVFTRVMVQCKPLFFVLLLLLLLLLLMTQSRRSSLSTGSMTLIIVPLVAQNILNAFYFINDHFWALIMNLDEYSPMMDRFEFWVEGVRDALIAKMPFLVMAFYHKIAAVLGKVPDSVWNTVPLTLLSCILGCLAVPYIIFKIDDYFQSLADRKKHQVQKKV